MSKLKYYFKGCLERTCFVSFSASTISCNPARKSEVSRANRIPKAIWQPSPPTPPPPSTIFFMWRRLFGSWLFPGSLKMQNTVALSSRLLQPSKTNRSTMFDGTCGVKAIVFKFRCRPVLQAMPRGRLRFIVWQAGCESCQCLYSGAEGDVIVLFFQIWSWKHSAGAESTIRVKQ